VREVAARAPGEIGDAQAVGPLIALLGQPGLSRTMRRAIAAALKATSGQYLGTDATRWQQWWEGQNRQDSA
jgi:HEAT repeat protein